MVVDCGTKSVHVGSALGSPNLTVCRFDEPRNLVAQNGGLASAEYIYPTFIKLVHTHAALSERGQAGSGVCCAFALRVPPGSHCWEGTR